MALPPREHPDARRQTLDEILAWYVGIQDSIDVHRASVRASATRGGLIYARFAMLSESEVDGYFANQLDELDRLTSLNLVASAEASIRLDYARRVTGNLGDPLSRSYQAWHAALPPDKQKRPDFDQAGILDRLKESKVLPNNDVVGRFRECLRPRHWVAHGRYWAKHADVDRLTPAVVHLRATELLRSLPP